MLGQWEDLRKKAPKWFLKNHIKWERVKKHKVKHWLCPILFSSLDTDLHRNIERIAQKYLVINQEGELKKKRRVKTHSNFSEFWFQCLSVNTNHEYSFRCHKLMLTQMGQIIFLKRLKNWQCLKTIFVWVKQKYNEGIQ